jgi:hypothetical protein
MNLYTLVLDFHGGTYITQFDAETDRRGRRLVRRTGGRTAAGRGVLSDVAEGIMIDAIENRLVEVEGLHGAWCAAATVATATWRC